MWKDMISSFLVCISHCLNHRCENVITSELAISGLDWLGHFIPFETFRGCQTQDCCCLTPLCPFKGLIIIWLCCGRIQIRLLGFQSLSPRHPPLDAISTQRLWESGVMILCDFYWGDRGLHFLGCFPYIFRDFLYESLPCSWTNVWRSDTYGKIITIVPSLLHSQICSPRVLKPAVQSSHTDQCSLIVTYEASNFGYYITILLKKMLRRLASMRYKQKEK